MQYSVNSSFLVASDVGSVLGQEHGGMRHYTLYLDHHVTNKKNS
jgi:hypothetical protein